MIDSLSMQAYESLLVPFEAVLSGPPVSVVLTDHGPSPGRSLEGVVVFLLLWALPIFRLCLHFGLLRLDNFTFIIIDLLIIAHMAVDNFYFCRWRILHVALNWSIVELLLGRLWFLLYHNCLELLLNVVDLNKTIATMQAAPDCEYDSDSLPPSQSYSDGVLLGLLIRCQIDYSIVDLVDYL